MAAPTPVPCPLCRQSPVRYQTLKLTGDVYAICDNYPDCSYVSLLDSPAPDEAAFCVNREDRRVSHPAQRWLSDRLGGILKNKRSRTLSATATEDRHTDRPG